MIIEKIRIDCFGNLEDLTLELEDGVNIIEGANESGKSTIASFIKFIFYGLGTKASGTSPAERERFVNWHTGTAGGHIVIRTAEAKYRIERTLIIAGQRADGTQTKKSYREGLQIIDLSNNTPVSGIGSPGEHFFGVDEEVYSRTAFINQLDGAKVDGGKLTQSIENILFSANESVNISKAIKKLDASRVVLLHKNGAGGQIYELEEKCAQLEVKLESAKQTSADILEKESSLKAANEKRESDLKKAQKLKREIVSYENSKIAELFAKKRECLAKLEEIKLSLDTLRQNYTRDGILPDDNYVTGLEAALEDYENAKAQADELFTELELARASADASRNNTDELEKNIDRLRYARLSIEKIKKRAHFSSVISLTFALIAVLFIAGGLACIYLDFFADIARLAILASSLPILLAIVFLALKLGTSSAKKKQLKLSGASSEKELDSLVKSAENQSVQIKQSSDRLEKLTADCKSATALAETALQKLNEKDLWKYTDDTKENIRAAKDVCDRINKIQIEETRVNEALELLCTQLSPYDEAEVFRLAGTEEDRAGIDQENIGAKRREYEFVSGAIESLGVRIHNLEKELASLYSVSDNPARIAEKIALARDFISECTKKHNAYKLALEKIEEASISMRDNISPKLADFTSKLMSELTLGKYGEIGIDSDFKVSVRTEAGTRELGYLSAGTQDITYVSLRLALISSLYRSNTPGVIFDESFSRLDNTRLTQMLKLLNISAKNTQCILFTSNDREAVLMNNVGSFGYKKL